MDKENITTQSEQNISHIICETIYESIQTGFRISK